MFTGMIKGKFTYIFVKKQLWDCNKGLPTLPIYRSFLCPAKGLFDLCKIGPAGAVLLFLVSSIGW